MVEAGWSLGGSFPDVKPSLIVFSCVDDFRTQQSSGWPSLLLTLYMPGVENYTFMPEGGVNLTPPLRSQLVVVRFSKSWALWFPLVLQSKIAKFH